MDLTAYVHALRDPAGVPFYPVVFQFLMVLTFTLHIIFVNFVMGGIGLILWAKFNDNPYAIRLAKGLAKSLPTNISIAITLGIAPLLFVQVIYDPFWYTVNAMSAWWAMGFLLFIGIAFTCVYIFYLTGQNKEKGGNVIWAIFAMIAVLLAALVMHGLSEEQLHPQKWKEWLTKAGTLKTSGDSLYAILIPRLTHFIVPAVAMIGIYLMCYYWLFEPREDIDKNYLEYVLKLGANLAFYGTVVQTGVGFWWLFSIPMELKFYANPMFIISAILAFVLLFILSKALYEPKKYILHSVVLAFLTIFTMSYARELLRMAYLKASVNYSIFTYPVNVDWGSTILFLGTFVMGIFVVGYMAVVAFKIARRTI